MTKDWSAAPLLYGSPHRSVSWSTLIVSTQDRENLVLQPCLTLVLSLRFFNSSAVGLQVRQRTPGSRSLKQSLFETEQTVWSRKKGYFVPSPVIRSNSLWPFNIPVIHSRWAKESLLVAATDEKDSMRTSRQQKAARASAAEQLARRLVEPTLLSLRVEDQPPPSL